MKTSIKIFAVIIFIALISYQGLAQQDNENILKLEQRHKSALENGNLSEATRIEQEMSLLTPEEVENRNISKTSGITEMNELPEGDWHSNDRVINYGLVKPSIDSGKTIDMKIGDDGVMYACVNNSVSGAYKGNILFYKSTDHGSNWSSVIGYLFTSYVGSISMLVESKDNSNPDSTRLIVFYTLSPNSGMTDASLNFISIRSNGTAGSNGTLATPPAGKKFSHVSAISDGAFYAAPTYFGVVCTESDNASGFLGITRTKYFRTVNWGASWLGTTLITGAADYFPSAGFKRGSPDSVYIAVERRVSSIETGIFLLKTSFVPTSAFTPETVRYFSGYDNRYRKPCLAIPQKNPVTEMVISYSQDKMPFYVRWRNAWMYQTYMFNIEQNYSVFTQVAAANDGINPFVAICMTASGDSINFVRIPDTTYVVFNYKINSQKASPKTQPLLVVRSGSQNNLVNIAYAGGSVSQDSLVNAYSDYEGNKTLNLKLSLQGLYNPNTNKLNIRDTVRIYLKRYLGFSQTLDSGKAVIDSSTLHCSFNFSYLPDSYCYIVVKHRNSLETWTQPLYFTDPVSTFDMTVNSGMAYGNNIIQTDNSPVLFSIYGGDVDQDGSIDATDLSMIDNDSYLFASGYKKTDINGDGFVDATDAAITDNNAANFVSLIRP